MKRILRIVFGVAAAFFAVLFWLSMTGIINNNFGNSFGFSDKTAYVYTILFTVIAYCILTDGWFTWIGEAFLICLDLFMLLIGGKTGFICLLVINTVLMWRHLRKEKGIPFQDKDSYGVLRFFFRIAYLPVWLLDKLAEKLRLFRFKGKLLWLMQFSFLISFALNILLAVTFRPLKALWANLPGFETFKDRLMFSAMAFEEFPIRLIGSDMVLYQTGPGADPDLYFMLDSSYIRLLLQFGLIPLIAVLAVTTLIQILNYKKGHYVPLFVLSVFSVDMMMDFSVPFVLVLTVFLPAVYMFCGKQDVKDCGRLNFAKTSAAKKRVITVLAVIFGILFAVWCRTAYPISTCGSWTPRYGATLVMMRSVLDEDEDIITCAGDYLLYHDDAFCIVESEEDKDALISCGIAPSRILMSDADCVDEMLVNARDMIIREDLPPRLTVVSYNMQKLYVTRRSDELDIPVNIISRKPSRAYLIRFMREQWRLLCGR